MLWLNSHNVRDLRTPFGGVKESGLGREGGQHSLDFYTEISIVHVALRRHPRPAIRSARAMIDRDTPNIVRAAYVELISHRPRRAAVVLGRHARLRRRPPRTTTRSTSAGTRRPTHHSLVLRMGESPAGGVHRVPRVGAGRPRRAPRRGTASAAATSSAARPARRAASARPCGSRIRSGSRVEFFHATDAHRAAAPALRPAPRRRHRPHRPLQHLRRRRRAPPTTTTSRSASAARRRSRTRRPHVRGVDAPQAERPRRRLHRSEPARGCTTSASSRPSSTTSRALCDTFGAHRRAAPHRARARPPRRVERLLRVPPRPRRPPDRDLHERLLHR